MIVTMQLHKISAVLREEGLLAQVGAVSVFRIVVFPAALLKGTSTLAADASLFQMNSKHSTKVDAILW